jgi:hypothetical protein
VGSEDISIILKLESVTAKKNKKDKRMKNTTCPENANQSRSSSTAFETHKKKKSYHSDVYSLLIRLAMNTLEDLVVRT